MLSLPERALFFLYFALQLSVLLAQEDGDNWPPIEEPWRCLEDPNAKRRFTYQDVMVEFFKEHRQEEDCPEVTDEICEEPIRYPMPCKLLCATL